ncbi:Serine/threonine-protein kinase DCLK2 [Fasciola gigantica]|uniref:non-specific serine/threonine protein kinase n=1 Tax=Fasciola gigantica TaxID=46835 RepID=A0A504YQA1_FASGI|nr:Serine/threonine-protein kinase DCLK2 [Fasciola gigantica]
MHTMATAITGIPGKNFIVHPFHTDEKYNSDVPRTIEKIMSIQKIVVFINGNPFFCGKNIIYDSRKYKSLVEFLTDLAAILPRDANLGKGIRRLFTPRGRHVVRTLEDLKHGSVYVCAGAEPFKSVNYRFRRSIQPITDAIPVRLPASSLHTDSFSQRELPLTNRTALALSTRPHPLRQSHPPLRALRAGAQLAARIFPSLDASQSALKKTAAFLSGLDHKSVWTETNRRVVDTLRLLPPDGKTAGSRQLIIIRPNVNGIGRTSLKVILCRSAVQTLGQVMCEISEAFGPRWSHDPIRHMYTVTGREVRSITDLFRQQKLFIATGLQRLSGPRRVPVWNNAPRETAAACVSGPDNGKEILFTGEEIRDIISEFWPDHPDPASVVIQWDRRLTRIRRFRAPVQVPRPHADSHGPLLKERDENTNQIVTYSTSELNKTKLTTPKSPRTTKAAVVISRVEERDSGFDESILYESKPTSQINSYPLRSERADADRDHVNHSEDQVNVDKPCEHAQISKSRLNKTKPVIKHPSPSWKSVQLPAGHRSSQSDSPSAQISVRDNQTGNKTDGMITKEHYPPAAGVSESAVGLPDPHRFVGSYQRATFMHPTYKWLSPFKTSSIIPALQAVRSREMNSLKEAENRSPQIEPTRTGCSSPSIRASGRQKLPDTVDMITTSQCSGKPKASSPNESSSLCAVDSLVPGRLEAIAEPEEVSKSKQLDGQCEISSASQNHSVEQTREQEVSSKVSFSNQRDRPGPRMPVVQPSQMLVTRHNATMKPRQLPEHNSIQRLRTEELDKQPKENSLEHVHPAVGTETVGVSILPNVQPPAPQITASARRRLLMENLNIPVVSDTDFLDQRYHIGRTLGDGNFAVVRLARRRDTGQQYAIKMIDKTKLKGKESMLFNEVTIMHRCNHPNIVRLYEEFETPKEIWLSMEYVKDGDLFDGITKSMKYSEVTASGIVRDLAGALFYLHCRSIVHRDLKPENVLLYRQPDGRIRVKLADFGLALEVKRDLHTICGTPTYIAPEILTERGMLVHNSFSFHDYHCIMSSPVTAQ